MYRAVIRGTRWEGSSRKLGKPKEILLASGRFEPCTGKRLRNANADGAILYF